MGALLANAVHDGLLFEISIKHIVRHGMKPFPAAVFMFVSLSFRRHRLAERGLSLAGSDGGVSIQSP